MMTNKKKNRGRCLSDTHGLATVEYVLLVCLVAIVTFGAWRAFGGTITNRVTEATTAIGQLPSTSDAPDTPRGSAMGSGAGMGAASGGGGGGCSAHASAGGGAGTPCDPASFGSCVGGGESTVVISCDASTGLTVVSTP